LTEDYEYVTLPLLRVPRGPRPLQYQIAYSHQAARKQELERRIMSLEIREEVLYAEAEEGYAALSRLLGENTYFFNET